jgi:beta-lactamase regulating signal transducer with metallopeptidase domain
MFSVYSLFGTSAPQTNVANNTASVLIPTEQITATAETVTETASISVWVVIWAVGVLVCALFFAFTYWKCQREFQTSLPVENDFTKRWLAEHRLKRPIAIRQSDRISAPLTFGIFHPVLLMPKTTDWKDETALQYILAHEYVHIRRFDTVTKLVLMVTLCVHWFNPLVWVMYVLANRDLELSCDETVIRQLGENTKSAYAQTLIRMEETRSGFTPLCNSFSKNAIEERITAIMKTKKTSWAAALAAITLVAGVTTAFATTGQTALAANSTEDTETVSLSYVFQPNNDFQDSEEIEWWTAEEYE